MHNIPTQNLDITPLTKSNPINNAKISNIKNIASTDQNNRRFNNTINIKNRMFSNETVANGSTLVGGLTD